MANPFKNIIHGLSGVGKIFRRDGKTLWRNVRVRVHALIVLTIVAWAGFSGIAYIFRSVFLPAIVPQKYRDWQGYMHLDTLQPAADSEKQTNGKRAPIRHYHGVSYASIYPDSFNGCLAEGCHATLPHGQQKVSRAFANFHTGFLACEACHLPPKTEQVGQWIDKHNGSPQNPPPVRQLLRFLDEHPRAQADPASQKGYAEAGNAQLIHIETIRLLGVVLSENSVDPYLEHLYLTMNTSEPLSPVWLNALKELRVELPRYVRGNYRRKIVWTTRPGQAQEYQQRVGDLEAAARRYYQSDSDDQKERILDNVHRDLLTVPRDCVSCHQAENPLLNFEALGYSAQQSLNLQQLPVARQVQAMRAGQTFHLAPGAEPYHE